MHIPSLKIPFSQTQCRCIKGRRQYWKTADWRVWWQHRVNYDSQEYTDDRQKNTDDSQEYTDDSQKNSDDSQEYTDDSK